MSKPAFSRESMKKRYYNGLLNIKEVLFERLEIVTFNCEDGKPGVLIWQGKQSKPVNFIKFPNDEKRDNFVKYAITEEKELMEEKKALAEIRKNAKHPYKVGDILTGSWGYDQTNVDAFQVTELKGKSLILERIGFKTVDGSEAFMSHSVLPVKDDFIYDGYRVSKIRKLPQTHNGKEWYVKLHHSCYLSLWDGSSMYQSYYA